jgi:hypothetical protein
MGFDEARVRDQVATALEQAIEDGRLMPSARGFRRAQAQVANAALMEPCEDDKRRTQLDAVHAERVERWARHGNARGGDGRDALLEPVLPLLVSPLEPVSGDAPRAVLDPALWLLERAATGIALTQTGALNRELVREVAERWPDWWAADLYGSPNREDDIPLLGELHDLLRRVRLLRRTGRRLILTTRGHALAADPPELLRMLARSLLAGDTFKAACGELAVALILNGAVIDYTPHLADRLRPAEALGLLAPVPGDTRLRSGPLLLTDVGRQALTHALRARRRAGERPVLKPTSLSRKQRMRNSGHAAARGGTTADAPGISFTGSNPTAVVRIMKIRQLTLSATSSERAGSGDAPVPPAACPISAASSTERSRRIACGRLARFPRVAGSFAREGRCSSLNERRAVSYGATGSCRSHRSRTG